MPTATVSQKIWQRADSAMRIAPCAVLFAASLLCPRRHIPFLKLLRRDRHGFEGVSRTFFLAFPPPEDAPFLGAAFLSSFFGAMAA